MMAFSFLQRKGSENLSFNIVSTRNKLVQAYVMLMKYSLRKPAQTIIGVLIFFFISVFLCLAVSMNNLQQVETKAFRINVTMSVGSTIEATDKIVAQIESRIDTIAEKEDISSNIQAESATVNVLLKEDFKKFSKRTIAQIRDDVQKRVEGIPGAQIDISDASETTSSGGGAGSGGGGGRITSGGTGSMMKMLGVGTNQERILIKGQDFDVMKNVAGDLQYFLESLESMNRVRVSYSDNRPEVHLRFYPLIMNDYNVSLANVLGELNSFNKEINTNIQFKQGTDQYDILIKEMPKPGMTLEQQKKPRTMHDLRTLPIPDATGTVHELQNVSEIVYSSGAAVINRVNREKQIEVSYSFVTAAQDSKDLLTSYRQEVDRVVESYKLPAGVAIQVIHEEDTLKDFYYLIMAAFILIFMILASVFESLSTPFVLMFSIPLAAIGSFVALILTGNSLFSANTLIGFIILIGIVVNNGIILIDYTNILRKRGYRIERALIVAGMSRIRPILITAIVTVVAMLPLAMGDNEYVGAIGAPFAITVIGGLSMSTLLTLIFIPTFYYGLENAINWLKELSFRTKVTQIVITIIGMYLIYTSVDSFLWQMLDLIAVVIVVPGSTWFIMNSLRKAKESVIDSAEPIHITVQNLVKIYDWGSRFQREWIGNRNIRERAGQIKYYRHLSDFDDFVWELPILGFMFYFTFGHLKNGLYMFIMAHFIFFLFIYMWGPIREYLENKGERDGTKWPARLADWGYSTIYWGLPLIFLVLFYLAWNSIGSVVMIGICGISHFQFRLQQICFIRRMLILNGCRDGLPVRDASSLSWLNRCH